MKKKIKYNKISKEIKKQITKIIFFKYNNLFEKKKIININYIYISKDLSKINIYINFINNKKKNIINNDIKKLKKNKIYIIKELRKKIYIKNFIKINFIYDTFLDKINNLYRKINKINKNK